MSCSAFRHLFFSSGATLNMSFFTGLNMVFGLKLATSAQVQMFTSSHLSSSSKNLPLLASSETSEARLCSLEVMFNYTMDVAKL
ncbi:hypothetical protein Bca4012_083618 [Brassica carinata]|uniref:Uncharacterized protein n=1 Tax=Brassica carinata TaxID=52824 RepID=A0A8X7SKE5_BRACI|nr:hypothetical protein Bca52824_027108 [Brassica carinata]